MAEYEFTLIVDGDLADDSIVDALYEAGCDDGLVGTADGVGVIDFTRDADTFLDAVLSAIAEVETVPTLRVVRVAPDELVTMTEIADRLGRTRESVRLLIAGARGAGDFPPPVSHYTARTKLWRWTDIAAWAGLDEAARSRGRDTVATNAALELRNTPPKARKALRRLVS